MAARTDHDLDARDLAILQLVSVGVSEGEIAAAMHLRRRTVRRVIAADRRAFPEEPLAAQRLAPAPGGAC